MCTCAVREGEWIWKLPVALAAKVAGVELWHALELETSIISEEKCPLCSRYSEYRLESDIAL